MVLKCNLLFLFILILPQILTFKVPDIIFELENNGFRLSLADEPGIKYVAFQVNKNRPFTTFSEGEFSGQVRSKEGNRWTFKFNHLLNTNDVIFVWTNVQHDSLVYRLIADPISVSNYEKSSQGAGSQTATTTTTTTTTSKPSNCKPTITVTNKPNVCKDDIIFEDSFDSLNSNVWQHEVRFPLEFGDNEFVFYDTEAQIENGILNIKPIPSSQYSFPHDRNKGEYSLGERCTFLRNYTQECVIKRSRTGSAHWKTIPPIVVPRINTKNSFTFKYGKVEIRAKVPKGDWIVPLLLLEPIYKNHDVDPYKFGQLRVAYTRGNDHYVYHDKSYDGKTLYGGAVLSNAVENRHNYMAKITNEKHFGDSYHVYTMIWTNEKLSFYLDNVHYGDVVGPFNGRDADVPTGLKNENKIAPFDQMFYIALGVSVGGFGDFPGNKPEKPWENEDPRAKNDFKKDIRNWLVTWINPELKVDYIKVYAV